MAKEGECGPHANFPNDPCLKWEWSLKHIAKLRDLLNYTAWERFFQTCHAIPEQFTLHLITAFLLSSPCNVSRDYGESGSHSTIYIKEVSSCPVKIALHSLDTDVTVQGRQPGSDFKGILKNIFTLMLSLYKYSSFYLMTLGDSEKKKKTTKAKWTKNHESKTKTNCFNCRFWLNLTQLGAAQDGVAQERPSYSLFLPGNLYGLPDSTAIAPTASCSRMVLSLS